MDRQPPIGINLPSDPRPEAISEHLRLFAESGFDAVEVDLDMAPLIVGGEIRDQWVDTLRSLLRSFPLAVSAHVSSGLDLRDRERFDLHEKVLESSIRVCASLRASPLVLHYEQESRDVLVEQRFADAHARAASLARECGVLLCIENIEVERMEPVVRLVREIDSPALRMTFDTGHAFLAAGFFHFDFLESLRLAAPVVAHLHLSDNTGEFERLRIADRVAYDALSKGMRVAFGRGDIHLPPFWGRVPFGRVFELTRGCGGIHVCEFESVRFRPFLRGIQERVRAAVAAARSR